MKEIKDDIKEWKHTQSWIRRFKIVEHQYYPKEIYKFNENLCQNLSDIFYKKSRKYSKSICNLKGLKNNQNNLEKEQNWKMYTFYIKHTTKLQ